MMYVLTLLYILARSCWVLLLHLRVSLTLLTTSTSDLRGNPGRKVREKINEKAGMKMKVKMKKFENDVKVRGERHPYLPPGTGPHERREKLGARLLSSRPAPGGRGG